MQSHSTQSMTDASQTTVRDNVFQTTLHHTQGPPCSDNEPGCSPDGSVSFDAPMIVRIFYLIIGSVGIIGNLFVIIVMLRFKHLRKTVTNIFIINQSIIDFFASFFIIMTSFLREIPESATPLQKEMMCKFWLTNMTMWGSFVSSTYNVVVMTFERYIAIVFPLKQSWRISHKKAYVLIVVVWMIGIVDQLVYAVPTSTITDDGRCTAITEFPSIPIQKMAGVLTIVVQFLLPLFLNTFANVHIGLVLRKQSKDSKMSASDNRSKMMLKAQKNVLKTLLLVFLGNVVCWVWNGVLYMLFHLGLSRISLNSDFYHFTVIAVFFNSCLNPFVYVGKYERFQQAAKELFCCQKEEMTSAQNTMTSSHSLTGTSDVNTGYGDDVAAKTKTEADRNKF